MNVLICGASGMIGELLLGHCLASKQVQSLTSLVRRNSTITDSKLTEVLVSDFLDVQAHIDELPTIDVVFYCLGVYTGAVNKETFRSITVDYPLALGRALAQANPDTRFCLLSGAGADRQEKSRAMFARDKGAAENGLKKLFPNSLHALRPGYIYPVTPRQEPNFSYKLMRATFPLYRSFSKNLAVTSEQLAQALFNVGIDGSDLEILENKDILKRAS